MSTLSSKQLDPVSCETQGHLWGDSACIMCKTPKPKYAPSLEFAMRQVERCRNYAPTDRVENEDTIVTLGDEIERLQEDLRLARIESAHFANTQRATQAELEMARVSSSELERYKRALYQANGQLMQLDKEPVKLDYSAHEPCANPSDLVTALAHRAVGNQEQDMQNGKLAGYCIVCQVPWPCDTAKHFLRPVSPPGTEWQPIDTAPHMRKIIVHYLNQLGNHRAVMACYYTAKALEMHDDYEEVGEWDESSGTTFAPAGWYEEHESEEPILPLSGEPTHWMPLPQPPSTGLTKSASHE
jgi:hypothetical protein